MLSVKIYNNLCERGKLRESEYGYGSGLHRHHIIPRHIGGLDEGTNYTYLTVREHILAHYLLYRIHGTVNDLRSMYMLGANLTVERRREIGIWCKENKIGYHKYTKEERADIAREQQRKRIESGNTNEWDFWASPEGRKKRSSIGGKKGGKTCLERKVGIMTDDKTLRTKWAKIGAATSPRKWANNPSTSEIKKFYTDEDRAEFIEKNPEWVVGAKLTNEESIRVAAASMKKWHSLPENKEKFKECRAYYVTDGTEIKKIKGISAKNLFLQENPEWKSTVSPAKAAARPARSRKVSVDGVIYSSMTEACNDFLKNNAPGRSETYAMNRIRDKMVFI